MNSVGEGHQPLWPVVLGVYPINVACLWPGRQGWNLDLNSGAVLESPFLTRVMTTPCQAVSSLRQRLNWALGPSLSLLVQLYLCFCTFWSTFLHFLLYSHSDCHFSHESRFPILIQLSCVATSFPFLALFKIQKVNLGQILDAVGACSLPCLSQTAFTV